MDMSICHWLFTIVACPYFAPAMGVVGSIGTFAVAIYEYRKEKTWLARVGIVLSIIWLAQSIRDLAQINSDARQIAEITNELAKTSGTVVSISPLNQPITDLSAIVYVKVKGESFVESPLWGSPWVAELELCDSKLNLCQLGEFCVLAAQAVDCQRISEVGVNPGHAYEFTFHPTPFGSTDFQSMVPSAETVTNLVQSLRVDVKLIPHNAEVLSGTAQIIVNGAIRKRFKILPQTASTDRLALSDKPNDSGFTIIVTNSIGPDTPMRISKDATNGVLNLNGTWFQPVVKH